MSTGTRIERLYLSLGLDLTEFDTDMAGAQAHVRTASAQLSRSLRLQRLRMDVDLAGVDDADSSLRGLGVRLGHLQSQLSTQRNQVTLLNHAYQESVRQLGANAAASRRLEERLLREQLAEARLEAQIRQTNQARRDRATASINTGIDNTAMLLAPVVAMGAASLKLASDAVESEGLWRESMGRMADQGTAWSKKLSKNLGLNEYDVRKNTGMFNIMFESMGMGTQKSYDLSTGLVELSNDMASLYNMPVEDAFEKLRAGMTGEMEPLKALGILVSEESVKNYAYVNSIAAQGAALTEQEKTLSRYGIIMDATKRAQGDLARTIDDPANAIRALKSDVEQLGIEFGKSLMPELRGFLAASKEMVNWYKTTDEGNKTLANSFGKLAIEVGLAAGALSALNLMGLGAKNPYIALAIAVGLATTSLADYLKKKKEVAELNASENMGNTPSEFVAKTRVNPYTGFLEKEIEEDGVFGLKIKRWSKLIGDELANVEKNAERVNFALMKGDDPSPDLNQLKADQSANKQREADEAKRQAQIAAQLAATKLKINQELSADMYKLTHTDLENSLHEIDLKVDALRKGEAEEVDIVAWAETAKSKIRKDESEKTQELNKQLSDEIYKLTHTALQVRLKEIDEERQAWIKKTGDEVSATKLAEQQKAKLFKETIDSQYGEEISAVKAAILAGEDKYAALKNIQEKIKKDTEALNNARDIVKKDKGIYEPGDTKRTTAIDGNSAYQITEVMKGFSDFTALIKSQQNANNDLMSRVTQAIADSGGVKGSANTSSTTNRITVNVPVNATINNDTDVTVLANRVADIIQPPLLKALNGGDDNGY